MGLCTRFLYRLLYRSIRQLYHCSVIYSVDVLISFTQSRDSGERPPHDLKLYTIPESNFTVKIGVEFPNVSCIDVSYTLSYKYTHHSERARTQVLWDISKNPNIYDAFAHRMHVQFNGTIKCNGILELAQGRIFTGKGRTYLRCFAKRKTDTTMA